MQVFFEKNYFSFLPCNKERNNPLRDGNPVMNPCHEAGAPFI
jgi:hypothetical protein